MNANPATGNAAPSTLENRDSGSAANRQPFLFFIPIEQVQAYAATVSDRDLRECRRLLGALEEVHRSRKILPACKRLSAQLEGRWSPQHIRTKYYQFTSTGDPTRGYRAGDWRIALNKAKARIDRGTFSIGADSPISQRKAFIEFWRRLGGNNQQDWSAAYDELLQIWRTGYGFARNAGTPKYTAIPGYPEWPRDDPACHHPHGWSYAHLMRFVSDIYDQTAERIGYGRASEHGLPVLTSRVCLPFGRYVEFDDKQFNGKVMFQKKPMRSLAFGGAELLTDYICAFGVKPTLWDYEEEVKRILTEREFMWFFVGWLTDTGYRADIGTVAICERGTSRIAGDPKGRPITDASRTDLEKRIYDATAGKVTICVGGRHGRPAHDGQFRGQPRGNFRTKAIVEGIWSIIDGQMASLPGQMGRDRDHSPEELYGAERYTAAIWRQVEALEKSSTPVSAEQIGMLKFPFPPYEQWQAWALDAVHRINTTRRHNIQGWDECGFVQPIWRLADGDPETDSASRWLRHTQFLALQEKDRAKAAMVQAILDSNPALLSTLRLSRQEVFEANRHLLTKLPWEMVPALVGVENAVHGGKPITVAKGLLSFERAEIAPGRLYYYARDEQSSAGQFLPNGEQYVCWVNPYAPSRLAAGTVQNGKIKVVAICPRYELGHREEQQTIDRLLGDKAAFDAAARTRMNLRHADKAAAKQDMMANNVCLLNAPRGTTPDPARARHLERFDRKISELASADQENDLNREPNPAADLLDTPTSMPPIEPDDLNVEELL